MNRTLSSLLVAASALVGACTDDHSHDTVADAGRPVCESIYERCHPVDQGTGLPHDCHEFAEDEATTNAQCSARLAECLAACPLPDGGAADATANDATANDAAANDAAANDAAVAADAHEHEHDVPAGG